jgi:hypothetical protein
VKVLVDPEALVEARNAAAFYEDSQPGLGKAFLAGVEAATEEILRHPLTWRRIKGRFRRYLIPRFPYGLIYAVQGDIIYVAAVMHLKRKPGYWTARTRRSSS